MNRFLLLLLGAAVISLSALQIPGMIQTQSSTELTEDQIEKSLQKLESYIVDAQKETGVPGVAVGVVFKDKVIYLKGFGVREEGETDPVTEDTVFQLASVSKPVASTVVASLVSEGVVSWDSKISELDPSFQLKQSYPTNQLTIRDLFSHRSGLPGEAGTELEQIGYGRAEILHRLRFVKPASSFRSAYSYSDFGYTEGAVAAVNPTGKSWEEVSREKLYKPLGMRNTSSSHDDFLKEKNRAALHIMENGAWTSRLKRDADAQSPGGGVSSSAADMAQWLRLQLGNGKYNGKQLISKEAIGQTHLPIIMRGPNPVTGKPGFYGMGWNTDNEDGRIMWGHAGAFSVGARTLVTLSPSEDLGIVVLSNAFPSGLPEAISATFFDLVRNGNSDQDWLAKWDGIYDSLFGQPMVDKQIAKYSKPASQRKPALPNSAYVGAYKNDYVGLAQVFERNDRLVLQLGPAKQNFPLKHYDSNVFLVYPFAETPDMPFAVSFKIASNGKASQVEIEQISETGGNGVLMRVSAPFAQVAKGN